MIKRQKFFVTLVKRDGEIIHKERTGYIFKHHIGETEYAFAVHPSVSRPEKSPFLETVTELSTGWRLCGISPIKNNPELAIVRAREEIERRVEHFGPEGIRKRIKKILERE